MIALPLLLSSPPPNRPSLSTISTSSSLSLPPSLSFSSFKPGSFKLTHKRRFDFRTWADDGDADGSGPDDYDIDEEEADEVDNKKDYDVEYEPLASDDITMVTSKSFVSTQGWGSEMIVDYRINEEEFHKISLLDCDFFIRKPPDPDNDVYDFREMYVTPPDTDVYAIPNVLSPMPQKYIRCAKSDYGWYNVTEPPIDAPRDPMYKSEKEILKIYLTKHYRNRRLGDPEFVMDFEEIYVIDSKTKSISRAKVVVKVPEGSKRDRKKDLLVVADKGSSFKIIPISERDDATTVIEREEWDKTRLDMEKHLSKLRDFSVSNWF
ncbi:PLASTID TRANSCRIPTIONALLY ACTIVE protein 6, chloroplastic [Impatiens glandulifera]|uniref:PLASTID TRANSCRIPTIONALLY ACTIVE protein 6, chloroplastic n=1 Tax=Impatiens glandulifera TaxID=253017 RepID=UPI001FB0E5BF|nr:PLASTID TRANSCRIPTIONALLY ACTIVE protein 6, chloroplastic [Impatiens glandulifera]